MSRTQILFLTLVAGLLTKSPAFPNPICTFTQVTDSAFESSLIPSLDDGSIAFNSTADLIGDEPARALNVFLWNGSEIHRISNNTAASAFPSLDAGSIAFASRGEIFLWNGSEIVQITDDDTSFPGTGSTLPSLNGDSVAFVSNADLTGENPHHGRQIYLYRGSTITQITNIPTGSIGSSDNLGASSPSLDGGSIAFHSRADLTGENPDQLFSQVFLFDGSTFTQVSDPAQSPHAHFYAPSLDGGSIAFLSRIAQLSGQLYFFDGASVKVLTSDVGSFHGLPSLDGGFVAFASTGDHTGENPDRNSEIFLSNTSTIWQLTHTTGSFSRDPSLDGNSIAFTSTADFTGANPDRNREIFLASCQGLVPALPPGPYMTSDEIPGFRFKVRITAGDAVLLGQREDDCVPETLCVSGALPGRSELFLRMIGPRPNGFLWTNLVRFTPSRVEVWVEQISSGTVNYYDLPALPREDIELTGLVDKQAFSPSGSAAGAVPGSMQPGIRAHELTPREPERPHDLVPSMTGLPGLLTFTSPAFPDFRFTVRIFSGTEEQPVQVESDCIPETICVSGALPGRSELFLRIIGPRPNGFLWTNLVRFTTSRVEVEIEQLASGETSAPSH